MHPFQDDLGAQISYWKDTTLAYGLILLGTCIVIYGIVAQ